ncbi:MAG: zinc-ribbon domain-containing protein, partial [Paludibacteraceae bacterium]|nr:zinc-ribbon domain-containing protein [Paludibacteraceae bacterium]
MKESICPECGEKIPAGVRICPNCDYELTEAEYKAANPEEEQA